MNRLIVFWVSHKYNEFKSSIHESCDGFEPKKDTAVGKNRDYVRKTAELCHYYAPKWHSSQRQCPKYPRTENHVSGMPSSQLAKSGFNPILRL